jgi:hypothetical protein
MNLKKALMDLGNKLVIEHGFDPGAPSGYVGPVCAGDTSTQAICEFTEWLNRVPEAREVLAEMGIEWPVVS